MTEPQEYAVQIPPSMADDQAAAAAFLRRHAAEHGWIITGTPHIVAAEPFNFGTLEKPQYLDGDDMPYVTCRAEAMRKPLPVFVPSEQTVVEAAKQAAAAFDPHLVWDEARPHVRNFYMRLAADGITAAGHRLVGDVLHHVGRHPDAYGDRCAAAATDTAHRTGQ